MKNNTVYIKMCNYFIARLISDKENLDHSALSVCEQIRNLIQIRRTLNHINKENNYYEISKYIRYCLIKIRRPREMIYISI